MSLLPSFSGEGGTCWRKGNEGPGRMDDVCFSEFSYLYCIFQILSKKLGGARKMPQCHTEEVFSKFKT